MNFDSNGSAVFDVPMALSPPSSRRTSEVLPPLTTSQLAPGSLRAIGDYPYPVIGTATTDSSKGSHGKVPMFPPLDKGFSIRAVNTPNQSGENQSFTRAKRGFSVSTQSQSPMFSPPVGGPPLHIANQLSQFDGSHSSKEVPQGWGVSTQSQSSVMPQSTTPSHKPSKTYWQNSSQMPSHTPSQTQPQTPPPERISDPFDLELAKIFPEGRFKFSNTPNSENSQLKRLTTQSRRPSTSAGSSVAGPFTQSRHPSQSAGSSVAGPSTQPRYPSHSAGLSVAGQSVNLPDLPFVTPCPKTTPTRRIGNRIDVDYHAGLQLHFNTKLLPKAQVYSFSVMANSLSAISRLLFNPFAKEAIADWEMDETKRVTECVIIMYGNIEEQIIKKDEALKKVTPYLPELKTCEKVDELYMGVKIWSEILAVSKVCDIDCNIVNVFDYFSKYFDSTIYHLFRSTLHRKPTHNIRQLSPWLNSVYARVEAVNYRARDLKFATDNIVRTLCVAKMRLRAYGSEGAMTELRVEKMVQKMEREGALRVLGGGCVLGDELSWREREMLMRLKRERTV